MAKRKRLYEPMWLKLKQHLTIKVELTTSDRKELQARAAATLRKALQKEKYMDANFRGIYADAKLTTEIVDGGRALLIKLDRGFSNNDKAMAELF